MSQHQTNYAFTKLEYFFSPSEYIDYQLGNNLKWGLQVVIDDLQSLHFKPWSAFALFSQLFTQKKKEGCQSTEDDPQGLPFAQKELQLDFKKVLQILENDGLSLTYDCLQRQVAKLQSSKSVELEQEMVLKSLFNVFYSLIYCVELLNPSKLTHGDIGLNKFYKDKSVDSFFIKLVTLSLQAHYLPIKKIIMIYTKVLANLFSFQRENGDKDGSKTYPKCPRINPTLIYQDQDAEKLAFQNLLEEGHLEKLKMSDPPQKEYIRKLKAEPIEEFYQKHNTGDCPLAQSIVVGLLRSLLTICNCQSHRKLVTSPGCGVDSFREWQLSYLYLLESASARKLCSAQSLERAELYRHFDEAGSNERVESEGRDLIFDEFYAHKMYTTSVTVSFFMLIMLSLKRNLHIQYLYFLQLLSDANGILVFLKFLTDKFQFLDRVSDSQLSVSENVEEKRAESEQHPSFKEKVMLTVYGILSILHCSCNNYPEKIKSFLFEYNSYLIIKKIPALFFKNMDKAPSTVSNGNKTTNDLNESPMQMSVSGLPSKEQIEWLVEQRQEQAPEMVRKLTEKCYELLKIQIPFFSKKQKDSSNNMKMLIDIYCRFPKTVPPIERSALDKMALKHKSKKVHSSLKYITSVEEMKNVHNQYNNLYYWSNDFVQDGQQNSNESGPGGKKVNSQDHQSSIGEDFDHLEWLENNLWKYYD